MSQNQLLADTALKLGKPFIGVIYEPKHANDGMGVQFLQAWMDGNESGAGWMKGQPWCATFASFLLWLSGNALGIPVKLPKTASSSEFYSFAKANGLILPGPIVGCLALQKGDGGSPGKTHHHTCIVYAVNSLSPTFNSLDGNFGDKVGMNTHVTADFDFVAVC